eukprot:11187203-Lingulodinium_polyedra.AAC.1
MPPRGARPGAPSRAPAGNRGWRQTRRAGRAGPPTRRPALAARSCSAGSGGRAPTLLRIGAPAATGRPPTW